MGLCALYPPLITIDMGSCPLYPPLITIDMGLCPLYPPVDFQTATNVKPQTIKLVFVSLRC
jgi:hypothetical protein